MEREKPVANACAIRCCLRQRVVCCLLIIMLLLYRLFGFWLWRRDKHNGRPTEMEIAQELSFGFKDECIFIDNFLFNDVREEEVIAVQDVEPAEVTMDKNAFKEDFTSKKSQTLDSDGYKKIPLKTHKCVHCWKVFSTHTKMVKHCKVTHQGNIPVKWTCKTCHKHLSSRKSWFIHQRLHTGERPYTCHICGKGFITSHTLMKHMVIHQAVRPYTCHTCGKGFNQKASLQRHEKTHCQSQSEWGCGFCPKTFQLRHSLEAHEKLHNGVKPFKCKYCSSAFHTVRALKQHRRVHTIEQPRSCIPCQKTFPNNEIFLQHMESHTKSCIHCKANIPNNDSLLEHIKLHDSSCIHCKTTFPNNDSLLKHIKLHRYPCKHCEKSFPNHDSLLEHMSIHSQPPTLKCPVCPMSFNMRITLRKHIRVHVMRGNVRFCNLCQLVLHSKQETIAHFDKHIKVAVGNKVDDVFGKPEEDVCGLKVEDKVGDNLEREGECDIRKDGIHCEHDVNFLENCELENSRVVMNDCDLKVENGCLRKHDEVRVNCENDEKFHGNIKIEVPRDVGDVDLEEESRCIGKTDEYVVEIYNGYNVDCFEECISEVPGDVREGLNFEEEYVCDTRVKDEVVFETDHEEIVDCFQDCKSEVPIDVMEVMNFEEVNDCTTRIKDEVVIVTDTKENEDIFQDFKMEVPGDVVEVMNFEEVNHCTTRIKDEVVAETDNKENVDCFQDFKVEVPGDVMRDLELEGVNECMRKEDKSEDMMHNEDNLSFSNECRKEVTEEVIYLGENTIKLENNPDSSTGTLMNNPKDIFDDFENNVYNAVGNGEVNRHSRDFKKNEYNVSINCDNSNLSEVSSIEISSTTMTVEDNRNKMIDCEQNTAKSTDVIYKKTTIINHDENANHSIVYKTGECDNNTPILSETNYINPSNDAKYSIVLVRLVPVLEKSLDKKCENDVNYCIEQSKIIPGVVKWKPFDKNLITGDNSLLNIVKNGANNSTIQNSVRKQDINSTVVTKSVRQKTDKNSRKKEVKKFKGDPMRTYTSNKAQSYEKSEQSICDVGIKEDKKECRVLKEDYNYLISKDKVVEGSMQVEGGSNGLRYGKGGIGEASNSLGIRQGGIGEASNRLGIRQGGIGEASNRLVNRQGGIGSASNQQGTIQGVMGEASNKLGVGLGEIEASNRLREGQVFIREASNGLGIQKIKEEASNRLREGQVFIREASNGLGIQQIKEEASNRLRKSQISMREALNGLGIHEVNKGASNESWEKQGVTEEPSNVLGIGQGVFSDGLGIQQVKENPLNGLGIGQGVAPIGLEEAIKGLSETVLQDTNYIENDSGFSSLEALCNVAASAAKYLKWDSVRSKRSPKKKNQCLNEIRFYCKTCNRSYPSSRDFRKHRCSLSSVNNRWAGIIESGGLFTCEECKRNFRSKNGYLIHRRSHTGERPYACRWCEKAFGDSGTRHKHERIHTGERPFQCEQCPRAFNQRAALRAHQITHSSCLTRSFTCKLCPSSFSYFANLRRHVIVCHREYTAIPCPLCTLPKTLHYDNTALVQHVKSVHWEDGTKCLICDQKQFDDVNEYCSHVISHVKRARNAGGVRLNNNFIKQEGDVSLV